MWILTVLFISYICSINSQTTLINIAQFDRDVMRPYKLLYPYEWKTGEFVDLETMKDCYCPRVYWPACSYNNVTYPNMCIMNCDKQSLKRLGPCIKYRRSMQGILQMKMPNIWRRTTGIVKVKPEDLTVENFVQW